MTSTWQSVSASVDSPTVDQLGRPLHELRISVTDRCNFRCSYCMPKHVFDKNYRYLPHKEVLSFEEITFLAKEFVAMGVRKIRLTGGEPLLRKNIDRLVSMLSGLRTRDGQTIDLAMTTNGALLLEKAQDLWDAGLSRLTVSLDSLNDSTFRRLNDMDFPLSKVLDGIAHAQAIGWRDLKINMVVQRGINDQEVVDMARYFHGSPVAVRFIEYMDVGSSNAWQAQQVVASEVLRQRLVQHFSLYPLPRTAGETAQRYGYLSAQTGQVDPALGEIGFISSVSQAFCRDCTRARLSTEGQLYLCLFATQGHDLRALLRQPDSPPNLSQALQKIWQQRNDRYSELREQLRGGEAPLRRIEMSYIGG